VARCFFISRFLRVARQLPSTSYRNLVERQLYDRWVILTERMDVKYFIAAPSTFFFFTFLPILVNLAERTKSYSQLGPMDSGAGTTRREKRNLRDGGRSHACSPELALT
ncbi:MAG: hypothetical protein V2A73_21715, partial [Pseudomonadota bacterium]